MAGYFPLNDRRCVLPPDIDFEEVESNVDDVTKPVQCEPPPFDMQNIYIDPYDLRMPHRIRTVWRDPFDPKNQRRPRQSSAEDSCCGKVTSCFKSGNKEVVMESQGSNVSEVSVWSSSSKGSGKSSYSYLEMNKAKVTGPKKAKTGCCTIM